MTHEEFDRQCKLPTPRTAANRSDAYAVQHYHDDRESNVYRWARIIICFAGIFAGGYMVARGVV